MADQDRQMGPWAMARTLEANIAEMGAKIKAEADPGEMKRLRKLRKLNRDLLRWCKSRAGYAEPPRSGHVR